jgi:hypothetical protein
VTYFPVSERVVCRDGSRNSKGSRTSKSSFIFLHPPTPPPLLQQPTSRDTHILTAGLSYQLVQASFIDRDSKGACTVPFDTLFSTHCSRATTRSPSTPTRTHQAPSILIGPSLAEYWRTPSAGREPSSSPSLTYRSGSATPKATRRRPVPPVQTKLVFHARFGVVLPWTLLPLSAKLSTARIDAEAVEGGQN